MCHHVTEKSTAWDRISEEAPEESEVADEPEPDEESEVVAPADD